MKRWRPKQERFARLLAAGRGKADAAREAEYSPKSHWPFDLARREDFMNFVAEIVREGWSGPDIGPVIAALMEGAHAAMKKDSAAGYSAAARMLAEAGRLKQKLPKTRSSELKEWARQLSPEVDRVAAAARAAG